MNDSSIFGPDPLRRESAGDESANVFEFEPVAGEFDEEFRRSPRARASRGRPRVGKPSGGRPRSGPRPGRPKPGWPPRRPRARTPYFAPYPRPDEPWGSGAPAQGSEYVRWTQDCLNRVMAGRLPVDGVMTAATRSLVRSFQRREGLAVTGIAGPDTVEALKRACAGAADEGGPEHEWAPARDPAPVAETETEFRQLPGTKVGAAMREALKQALPAGVAPTYRDAGTLARLVKVTPDPGLYLISFKHGATTKAYSGKANNLYKRLLQHRHCAQMFLLPLANFRVLIAPLPGLADPKALRATEKKINRFVRKKHPDVFTNQRSEIEESMAAEGWG